MLAYYYYYYYVASYSYVRQTKWAEYIVELYKWKFLTSRVYVSDRFISFMNTTYMWLMHFRINLLYLDRHCHYHI